MFCRRIVNNFKSGIKRRYIQYEEKWENDKEIPFKNRFAFGNDGFHLHAFFFVNQNGRHKNQPCQPPCKEDKKQPFYTQCNRTICRKCLQIKHLGKGCNDGNRNNEEDYLYKINDIKMKNNGRNGIEDDISYFLFYVGPLKRDNNCRLEETGSQQYKV